MVHSHDVHLQEKPLRRIITEISPVGSRPVQWVTFLSVITVLLLSGCRTAPPAPVEERMTGEQVRQQAKQQKSLVEVYSLGDPAAEEWMNRAYDAEDQGDISDAIAHVNEALKVAPEDSEYWQYLAELELQDERYQSAIEHAQRSYDNGPQLGQLCYRNWLVISRSLSALNREAEAAGAKLQADQCPVEAPERY